ncbi:hypothetical protein [Kutzneria buriramensis]|uniref:hypothetical protein n=1 Tax=Kutzneria buriramensis TaxID=1045776 RepID=UPI000E24F2B0|nr:hypothetical protein [Kutzneria buriramensis]
MTRHNTLDDGRLLALFPDAVACWTDLVRLGVDQSLPARRCRPGGGWTRLLTGVYLLTGGAPNRRQMVRAALLRAGPNAVITGVEAARRHGVRRVPAEGPVHVLVEPDSRLGSQSFMLVERSKRRWSTTVVDGIPLVSAARALVDAARREGRLDVVRSMIADGLQRNVCTIAGLTTELAHLRLRGSALPRMVLTEVDDGVRSAAEAWARRLVLRSRLPAPAWNVELRDEQGRSLAVVDAWWEDVGLAWEIDSREFHLAPADHERTTRRHSALTAAGVLVVHTVPSRLHKDPAGVLRDLCGAYDSAVTRSARVSGAHS